MFQDSVGDPSGGRVAVHEYAVHVTIDPARLSLRSIAVNPGNLPFRECFAASENVNLLIGTPLTELRETVLTTLRREMGCTHLNDALRALADVPILVEQLRDSS